MNRHLIPLLFVSFLNIHAAILKGACRGNLVWNDCASACPSTCENPDPVCTDACSPSCACPPEAPIMIEPNQRCGTLDMCSDNSAADSVDRHRPRSHFREHKPHKHHQQGHHCPGNLVFSHCASICPQTCSNPNITCDVCTPGCTCPPESPILIDILQCGNVTDCEPQVCPGNLVWQDCAPFCPRTCQNPFAPYCAGCKPGCACPVNYLKWNDTYCVPESDCIHCPGNLEFQNCPSPCPATCENPSPTPCEAFCVNGGCGCPANLPILINETFCGTIDSCSKHICPGNLEWKFCPDPCPPTCGNPIPQPCTKLCPVEGCGCPANLPVRINETYCGMTDSCPKHTCPGNLEWLSCPDPCFPTCDNPSAKPCKELCPVEGCGCPASLPIRINETLCGTVASCSQHTCPGNLEWMFCPDPCPPTCENPLPQPCTKLCVMEGCGCPHDRPILVNDTYCSAKCESNSCPGNLEWQNCPNLCPPTCETPGNNCMQFCLEPGCGCPSELPVKINSTYCGVESSCPPQPSCPGNLIWQSCPTPCPPTCADLKPICPESLCIAHGCGCPPDLPVRLNDTHCGTYESCLPQKCPGNLIWQNCPNLCPPTCTSPGNNCKQICNKPGCGCPPDFPIVIKPGELCGTQNMCPITCPKGQTWTSCPCDKTCDNLNPNCPPSNCTAGCSCPTNKVMANGKCVHPLLCTHPCSGLKQIECKNSPLGCVWNHRTRNCETSSG